MKLTKIEETEYGAVFDCEACRFGAPVSVQGGIKRSFGEKLLVESGGRYKLFSDGKDYVKILAGCGHFKWARGETPFTEGECFLLENAGEYELNGKCKFLAVRR